jgi:DNA invertase Pin-like site-specific DNA recombinase
MTARRAAIYARVSTGAQDTENQLRVLREVAERSGWGIVHEYRETASGATARRPELDKMLADAARRRFDVVMVWDISRLGRSLRDLLNTFEALRAVKVDLHIHQQGIDTATPLGEAMMQMSGIFAQFERAMIVERTKAGMARARARGKRIGRPPASDAMVSAIRALRAKGRGMDAIAKELRCGKSLSLRICQEYDREQREANAP